MKSILTVWLVTGLSMMAYSQAKRPSLMVLPSDAWCKANGCVTTNDAQGVEIGVPNYQKAFETDFSLVNTKIGELMTDRGFPLKDLEGALKVIQRRQVDEAAMGADGMETEESVLDMVRSRVKPDLELYMEWKVNRMGSKQSITFIMRALDAYTFEQVAAASGTGENALSNTPLPVLLEEAVLNHLNNFCAQLDDHFNRTLKNGRKVTLEIALGKDNGLEKGLRTEFDDTYLSEIIETWVSENTVGGNFNTTTSSRTRLMFEDVRIPLYSIDDKAIDTGDWAKGLDNLLRKTYQLDTEIDEVGLGEVKLMILGSK
ncbi:MAG: DUF6175 family protein [Tannerella sp.]|jgi:hypothetical protein|nr:DUF6175 family protein [Tannerella sp.]